MGLFAKGGLDWTGREIVDATGEHCGTVQDVLTDEGSTFPHTLVVETGRFAGFGAKTVALPVNGVQLTETGFRLPWNKERLLEAPELLEGDDLRRNAVRDFGPATGTAAETILSEERLTVIPRAVPAERVRLVRKVVEEEQQITVRLRREVLEIEHVPVDPAEPPPFGRDAVAESVDEIVLLREEPVVEARAVPYEKVRLVKEIVADEERGLTATRRREEAAVEHVSPAS
jgi:sporulation protein YlmC with PRC-barrel domain/stress response protein YsnF